MFSFDISMLLKGLTALQTGTTNQLNSNSLMVFYLHTVKTRKLGELGEETH